MKATTLLVFVALGLLACHAMARPTQHRASPRVNVAPKAVQKIAVAGSGYYTNVAALLRERLPGVQVDTYASAPSGAVVTTYDTIVLLRVNGNVDIINYVKNGGRLVTEWSAGGWAVDTAQLLGATRTNHSGYVGSATPITFLAPGQGLSQGVHNPYTDDGRTEYFYSFNIDNQVATIQGTITRSNFDMQPVFLTGVSQKGCVVILGDDWSDSFGSANSDTQQLIVNAVQFVCDSYENSCLTDCCNAHATSKCEDEGISNCVCGHSGFQSCCTTEWTQSCANAVQQFGCGDCKTAGSCCIAHSDGGCINRNTTSCVCSVDSTCCTGVWDAHCVQLVQSHNCAECHADCCLAHNSPGCTENSIQKCVCSIQPFCCDVVWDSFCVEAVEKYSCGSCCS